MRKLTLWLVCWLGLLQMAAFSSPDEQLFGQGKATFDSGQYGEAAQLFERQLQSSPRDALTHYYLALCFHCLQKYREATGEYNWVLLNSQDPELIKRLQISIVTLRRHFRLCS